MKIKVKFGLTDDEVENAKLSARLSVAIQI